MAIFDRSDHESTRAQQRREFLSRVPPEQLADDFPSYIDRQSLARYLVRYELFKEILTVKGSIVECGVYRGASLMLFAQLSACLEPYAFIRKIIGFDTFEGFPHVHPKDGPSAAMGDLGDTNYELLKAAVELYDSNRPFSQIPKVELIKGDAMKTIPVYFEENPSVLVSLLYLDFDLYDTTKLALEVIVPRMPKGAISGLRRAQRQAAAGRNGRPARIDGPAGPGNTPVPL